MRIFEAERFNEFFSAVSLLIFGVPEFYLFPF